MFWGYQWIWAVARRKLGFDSRPTAQRTLVLKRYSYKTAPALETSCNRQIKAEVWIPYVMLAGSYSAARRLNLRDQAKSCADIVESAGMVLALRLNMLHYPVQSREQAQTSVSRFHAVLLVLAVSSSSSRDRMTSKFNLLSETGDIPIVESWKSERLARVPKFSSSKRLQLSNKVKGSIDRAQGSECLGVHISAIQLNMFSRKSSAVLVGFLNWLYQCISSPLSSKDAFLR